MNRKDLANILNNGGIGQQLSALNRALLIGVSKTLLGEEKEPEDPNLMLLNGLHPSIASEAFGQSVKVCQSRGLLTNIEFNGSINKNLKLIQNDGGDGCNTFTSVLRQFLLPRYAYLDFDNLVDPRHQIDFECGYPKFITPIMYRYMYDRDDVARKVVDFFPDECFAVDPEVYETEDEDEWSPFELTWKMLCEDFQLLQMLYRIDKLSGIGHYGLLLMGLDDGLSLDQPIQEPELLMGKRKTVATQQRRLLYLRPFDEYLSFIMQYETDVNNPRYGLPLYYNLVFLDMTIDAAGASIGTRLNRRVHWSRCIPIMDNPATSMVFGTPRMQPVFNRLLDLRKIKGGSAEMFWKGAFPGIMFEVDPQYIADDPEFNKDEFREEVQRYMDGMQKSMLLMGIKANSLAPNISEHPDVHVRVQEQAIASQLNIPLRIWQGSEEGRLASSQDKLTWNFRLGKRCKRQVEPNVVRQSIDRFIAVGVMPPPSTGRYSVGWGDLNTTTDEDKANLALKWTQALSQYVATGIIHFIGPMDYLTMFLGIRPTDAKKICDWVEENGGWAKLKAVDPDQGAGQNGERKNNVSKGDKEGSSGAKPPKRDSSDKKTEGMTS